MSHDLHASDGTIVTDDGQVIPPEPNLLVVLAQTHPGIVRTLRVLHGELEQTDDLPESVRERLAEHLRELADSVDGVVVIDGDGQ